MNENIKEFYRERMYLLWQQERTDKKGEMQVMREEVPVLQQIYLFFGKVAARKPKDFQDEKNLILWSTFSVRNIATRLGIDNPVVVYDALRKDGHKFYFRGDNFGTAVCKTLEFSSYERQLVFMGTDAKWASVLAELAQ